MQIAIDGYNFIKQNPDFRRLEQVGLQEAREGLIGRLAEYKRLKPCRITVVFDGIQEGRLAGHRERVKGIEVVFSRPGEKADDVLKRMAGELRGGVLIVTSDREVSLFAEKKGAPVVSVDDFADRMDSALLYSTKGGEEEAGREESSVTPSKKGPSRRLPKSRRRAMAAMKKL